ncbi:3-deoxy-7-phosphoheptulonate synthase [Amycolatopsis sp. NPDC059027]|uniref:3-deoxy-7-phosphoheptulonate synthase n=1 Tax=unclassified Amycolatopsis TaxID=2618356 RepID=UPI00366B8741
MNSHMDEPATRRQPSAAQQPDWPDPGKLSEVVRTLERLPSLVSLTDCDALRDRLAAVARGDAFLFQAGDCAELFAASQVESAEAKIRCLADIATVLTAVSGLPIVTVGRIAGQYAKPRSTPTETRDDDVLPAYRGDAVNSIQFTAKDRTPDPRRLLRAYRASARTLLEIRKLQAREPVLRRRLGGNCFTSHEALLLPYENALTRTDPASGRRYGASGHLLWIGERTRQISGPHIAFAARVCNPIAVKLGRTATPGTIAQLVERLDPQRQPGRLTFITRFGSDAVREMLPPLVEEALAVGSPAAWVCDPMHGNTFVTPEGRKTRRLETIHDEIRGFFEVHKELGTIPGGLHLEVTSRNVTECIDSGSPVRVDDLHRRYETACDPRLNRDQVLRLTYGTAPLINSTGWINPRAGNQPGSRDSAGSLVTHPRPGRLS